MRKSKTKFLTLLIPLLIVLGFAGWRLSLADVYWQKTDIVYAAWRQPDQRRSNWSNSYFMPRLLGALFDSKIVDANFSNANLSHISLIYLHVKNTKFNSVDLSNSQVVETHFENSEFVDANMENSSIECVFKGCDLRNVDLKNADLRFVLFWHSDLRGANLEGANLVGASIWDTDLRGANLTGAHLHAAWLHQSDLRGVDLKGAEMGVMYDSQTKWPKGFDVNKDGSFLDDRPPVLGGR